MIIAPDKAFADTSLDYPRLKLENYHGTPMEQGASAVVPFRKCNFVVNEDYTKRLSILGFSVIDFLSFRSESLAGGATIPVEGSTWPLNGRED
jgi:hypothetical protein